MPKTSDLDVIDATPLHVRPETRDALLRLKHALQDDARLYHDCVLFLRKLQRTEYGPLTEALAVFVGGE